MELETFSPKESGLWNGHSFAQHYPTLHLETRRQTYNSTFLSSTDHFSPYLQMTSGQSLVQGILSDPLYIKVNVKIYIKFQIPSCKQFQPSVCISISPRLFFKKDNYLLWVWTILFPPSPGTSAFVSTVMPRGGGGARLRRWQHWSHWVLSSTGWLYPVPFIRHFSPLGFQWHCLCRAITDPWHTRNCWMLGFLPKGIIIPEQETSDVLDPGGPLQVDGPTATFFETKKKWSTSKLCLKPLPDCGP